MASLTIVTRAAKDGPRYLVHFRLGGRAYPWVHAGSFRTRKEAKVRRDLVAGESAAGRNPVEVLRALAASPATVASLETWGARFLASGIDVDENTKKNYGASIKIINQTFGDRERARSPRPRSRSGSPRSPRPGSRARSVST